MKKLILSLTLFAGACVAQNAVTLTTTCPTSAKPGATITCTLSTTGTPAGIQGTFVTSPSVAWTATTPVTGDTLATNPGASNIFVLFDIGTATIPNGPAVVFSFTMPTSPVTVVVNNPIASDANGASLPATSSPAVTIALQNNCDLNGDGVVNAADITQEISNIFSGTADVTGLMKVVVADLGGVCLL